MSLCIAPSIRSAPLDAARVSALLSRLAPVPSSRQRSLTLGLIGPGRVGSALLAQLRIAQPRLARDSALQLRLRGVLGRSRMWLDCDDDQLNARQGGAQVWRPNDLDAFAGHVCGPGDHAVLVDCSASNAVADYYPRWLTAGIHVVTPNKRAGSGPLLRWQAIRNACAHGAHFRAEATVCAGLPVVQTLRDLLDTGDELLSIEGMFSGTLAWLCNRYDAMQPFSALLREAHALGYTEPDPREDLSGIDVARKLVILAREAGWPLSLEDVEVESLVPDALASLPLEACMQQLDALDAPFATRLERARSHGGVLRHVARLDHHGRACVALEVLPREHAFAHSRLTDNVVQFTSARYCDNPLLVQGPGAGPEVTAAGVFADVLRIAQSLPVNP